MEILNLIYNISQWILVVGGALIILILIFILCKVLFILSKINKILSDISYKYSLINHILSKPFVLVKKLLK